MLGSAAARGSMLAVIVAAALWWPAVAVADWSPTPTTQLNATGTSVVGISAASVAGVPFVAWAQAPDPNNPSADPSTSRA